MERHAVAAEPKKCPPSGRQDKFPINAGDLPDAELAGRAPCQRMAGGGAGADSTVRPPASSELIAHPGKQFIARQVALDLRTAVDGAIGRTEINIAVGHVHAPLAGDGVVDGKPVCRQKDNPSPQHVLLRTVAITDDGGQAGAVIGLEENADGLCHAPRFAWITAAVNPLFGSLH